MMTKNRAKTRHAVAIATFIAAVVFIVTMHGALWSDSYLPEDAGIASASEAEAYAAPVSVGLPERLSISAIGVDAKVNHVGLTAEGNMATPGNFRDVGWYKYGTVPGELGSAVIAGHLDNALALSGVFKDLNLLKVGDEIYVTTEEGQRLAFRVSSIDEYPYNDAPNDIIFNEKTAPKIRLITCTGDWMKEAKTYSKRLVVTAVLI